MKLLNYATNNLPKKKPNRPLKEIVDNLYKTTATKTNAFETDEQKRNRFGMTLSEHFQNYYR